MSEAEILLLVWSIGGVVLTVLAKKVKVRYKGTTMMFIVIWPVALSVAVCIGMFYGPPLFFNWLGEKIL